MLRRFGLSISLGLALVLMSGCSETGKTSGTGPGDKAKEEAKKGELQLSEAKAALTGQIKDMLPKIEEKIKAMTGDKQKEASAKLDELKKMVDDLKTTDAGKMKELQEKTNKAFEDLKKMVGL